MRIRDMVVSLNEALSFHYIILPCRVRLPELFINSSSEKERMSNVRDILQRENILMDEGDFLELLNLSLADLLDSNNMSTMLDDFYSDNYKMWNLQSLERSTDSVDIPKTFRYEYILSITKNQYTRGRVKPRLIRFIVDYSFSTNGESVFSFNVDIGETAHTGKPTYHPIKDFSKSSILAFLSSMSKRISQVVLYGD